MQVVDLSDFVFTCPHPCPLKNQKPWKLIEYTFFRENGALHGVANGLKWKNAKNAGWSSFCFLFKGPLSIKTRIKTSEMTGSFLNNLHFWALFHLGPFVTPCNAPFSRKKVHSFLKFFFYFLGGFHSFDGVLKVISITSVVELAYNPVFMCIVQRCKFCCVKCWVTSRT